MKPGRERGRGQAHTHKQELYCENSRESIISLLDAASCKWTWGMRSQEPRVESLGRSRTVIGEGDKGTARTPIGQAEGWRYKETCRTVWKYPDIGLGLVLSPYRATMCVRGYENQGKAVGPWDWTPETVMRRYGPDSSGWVRRGVSGGPLLSHHIPSVPQDVLCLWRWPGLVPPP